MSNPSCDPFDLSPPNSAREHPETEWHSAENGEVHLRDSLKRLREALPVHSCKGAACLAVGILTHTLLAVTLGTELAGSSHAQVVPRSLEQGGPDAALRQRKNTWTVGVAGGQLSGTYMNFADELAQVLDDGDNLRVIPIVTYGAASNLDDLLYLRQVDVVVTQSDVLERLQPALLGIAKIPREPPAAHFMRDIAKAALRTAELRDATTKCALGTGAP